MRLRSRVVLDVALQKIDNTPDAQARAQSNHQSLQNTNSAIEKCHIKSSLKMVLISAYSFTSISYTSKRSPDFTTARSFFMYRSMSKRFLGSASAVYL